MAIVKVKYTRSSAKIKAHLRYITHRPDREGEAVTRFLFDSEGLTTKLRSYQMIDAARRGRIFFKVVISPDPIREDRFKDLDLAHIARKTIRELETKLGHRVQFVAAIHGDHAPHRHIHGIVIMHERLSREDFSMLRKAATKESQFQRRMLDLSRPQLRTFLRFADMPRRGRSARASMQACPDCGARQNAFRFRCFSCGAHLQTQFGAKREERHLAW